MEYWLLDVRCTVAVNGKDVAFDYVNTYYEQGDAFGQNCVWSYVFSGR